MKYLQTSVAIMPFGDRGAEWIQKLVPIACVKVTENKCYHFTATKTSVTVAVKQHGHGRVNRCTFSVDFEEIKTISQSVPSTAERLKRIG